MSRLEELFARCRAEDRAALIGYLPVGFPSYQASVDGMLAMVEGGVDTVPSARSRSTGRCAGACGSRRSSRRYAR